jgi:hypothetical protein
MRFLHAGILGVGVLISQLAAAATPASTLQQLGAVQAAIDYCSKADAADIKKIERSARILLPDMSYERISAVKNKPEFKDAYAGTASVLKNLITPADGLRLCEAVARDSNDRHEPKSDDSKPEHRR